jgi:hypothetical protein
MKHKIKFSPVGNGDQSLITLKDGTTILIDCNIRQASLNSTDPLVFDVKKDLLKSIRKRDNNPFLDVFVLTHGDCDHCRGYKTNFYQGDPKKYSAKNREANEIIIDEMWFSPMIAEEHTNDDEDAYQTEAERRLELHRTKHADRDLPGNRIKIIGYDGNKEYSDLNHLRAIPGTIVNTFNNKTQDLFSVFIHAPFKEHLKSAEKDKNSTSIVFQARFKENAIDSKFSGLAIFGGDSDHYSWDIILKKTQKYGNDKKEQALDWDIFLAPHHCSWSFFNDRPQEDNPDPVETSRQVLDYKRAGGKIIASSKKIIDDGDNPPHYEAKQEYLKKLTASADFLNTTVEPKESKPEPIVFEIMPEGVKRITYENSCDDEKLKAAVKVTSGSIIKQPWCK